MRNILLLFISLLICSCAFLTEGELVFDENTFNEQQRAWLLSHSRSYQYTFDYSSDGGPQPDIIVRIQDCQHLSSEIDPLEYEEGNWSDDYGTIDDLKVFRTMDELYIYVSEAAESYRAGIADGTMRGAAIEVIYNEENHYPSHINASADYGEGYAGGLYFTVNVSEFSGNLE